jgi:hypothetical protein
MKKLFILVKAVTVAADGDHGLGLRLMATLG